VSETRKTPEVHRFGVFELDTRARELRKQGRRIRLQDQSFHILALLLQRPGEVVTREELREQLWPASVYVDFDHGLNNALARLRRALGGCDCAIHRDLAAPRVSLHLSRRWRGAFAS
jgi:DNA-binding winged helix-turn-helix (wHTH) protein